MARSLPATGLDFDEIKSNLKDFLRGQSAFADFDFEGSAMSILLDVLTYNTTYLAYNLHMSLNEAFLDSALIRESVVSLAKHLGYTPRSVNAASAEVDITWATDPGGDFLAFGTGLSTSLDGEPFTFITISDVPIRLNNDTGLFESNNVLLKEGTLQTIGFVVNRSDPDQRFMIPELNVDVNVMEVRVQASEIDLTGLEDTWLRVSDINTLNPTSKIFYLQEAFDGRFEIIFGDGILGQAVQHGNVVTIQYLVTSSAAANKAGEATGFNLGSANVTVLSAGAGGAEAETIESIKFTAPLNFSAQNRAVTADDYEALVRSQFGDIESVLVFGGEDADPPQFGSVFISLKPRDGVVLSETEKFDIANRILKSKNVVGITPQIIDPEFLYVLATSKVIFDPTKTTLDPSSMQILIEGIIEEYGDTVLDKFSANLRFSDLICRIDEAEIAIVGNTTTLQMQKRFEPVLNIAAAYTLTFANPIFHPEDGFRSVIESTAFTFFDTELNQQVEAFLDDDGNGNIRVFRLQDAAKKIIDATAGVVNYTTGTVELFNFRPLNIITDTFIRVTTVPATQDILVKQNQILTIDANDPKSIVVTTELEF